MSGDKYSPCSRLKVNKVTNTCQVFYTQNLLQGMCNCDVQKEGQEAINKPPLLQICPVDKHNYSSLIYKPTT